MRRRQRARDPDAWRLSDWKEAVAVLFFLAVATFGACSFFDRVGKTLDENREEIKATVAKVGELAGAVGGVAADVTAITSELRAIAGKAGPEVDKAIDAIKDKLGSWRDLWNAKFDGLRNVVDGKPGEGTIWERLAGLAVGILGLGAARNTASNRKKKRHNERIYGELATLKDRLVRVEGNGEPPPPTEAP